MAPLYRRSFDGGLDRLSSLLDRLRVQVSYVGLKRVSDNKVNFRIFQSANGCLRLAFAALGTKGVTCNSALSAQDDEDILVEAHISVEGVGTHLFKALPECISVSPDQSPFLKSVVGPLLEEITQPRCGGHAVFQRLCEVVVIRLIRHALEQGEAETGLLAGLTHPRIAEALVAIHEVPGEAWTLERLAAQAGMSRTQFAVSFKERVGVTPMVYLSNWRLEIARSELADGRSVKTVAAHCGFQSAAAFSRAFTKRFGFSPKNWMKRAA